MVDSVTRRAEARSLEKEAVRFLVARKMSNNLLTVLGRIPRLEYHLAYNKDEDLINFYLFLAKQLSRNLEYLDLRHPYIPFLAELVASRKTQLISPLDYWLNYGRLAIFVSRRLEEAPQVLLPIVESLSNVGLHPHSFRLFGYDYISSSGEFYDSKFYQDIETSSRERYKRLIRVSSLPLSRSLIRLVVKEKGDSKMKAARVLYNSLLYFMDPEGVDDDIEAWFQELVDTIKDWTVGKEQKWHVIARLAKKIRATENYVELFLQQLEVESDAYISSLCEKFGLDRQEIRNRVEIFSKGGIGISINVHWETVLAILDSGRITSSMANRGRVKAFIDSYRHLYHARLYIGRRVSQVMNTMPEDPIFGALYTPMIHTYGGVNVLRDLNSTLIDRYGPRFFLLETERVPFSITPWDSFTNFIQINGGITNRFLPPSKARELVAFQSFLLERKGVDFFEAFPYGLYSEVQLYPMSREIKLDMVRALYISGYHLYQESNEDDEEFKANLELLRRYAHRYGLEVFIYYIDESGRRVHKLSDFVV